MHYQLFIPTRDFSRNIEEVLGSVGCVHLVERSHAEQFKVDDQPGILISWMTRTGRIHKITDPEWIPAKPSDDLEAGRYLIGVNPADLPSPQDLQRNYPQVGEQIVMGDGQLWIVPRECELPHQVVLADDGTPKFEPLRKFHEMHILSGQWRKALTIAEVGHKFVELELAKYVDFALQINYRTLPELTFDILNLYTSGKSGSIHTALRAAISASLDAPLAEVSNG